MNGGSVLFTLHSTSFHASAHPLFALHSSSHTTLKEKKYKITNERNFLLVVFPEFWVRSLTCSVTIFFPPLAHEQGKQPVIGRGGSTGAANRLNGPRGLACLQKEHATTHRFAALRREFLLTRPDASSANYLRVRPFLRDSEMTGTTAPMLEVAGAMKSNTQSQATSPRLCFHTVAPLRAEAPPPLMAAAARVETRRKTVACGKQSMRPILYSPIGAPTSRSHNIYSDPGASVND